MKSIISKWLPITKRNRVALGFAALALVMFVTWNLLPAYNYGESTPAGRVFQSVWPIFVDLEFYRFVMSSLDKQVLRIVFIMLAVLFQGLLVFTILPFWKVIHASRCLTVSVAVANIAGGFFILWELFTQGYQHASIPYQSLTLLLVGLTMLMLATALFIFKNELELRYEIEVEETLNSKL